VRKIALAEFVATAFLLIAVVGSGIAAERMAEGNVAIALLANAVATGGALFALIVVFAPMSGAHMNPAVSITAALTSELPAQQLPVYVIAQVLGAVAGVMVAHAMFELPIIQTSDHARSGGAQWLSEFVATLGLLGVVWGTKAKGAQTVAASVALYIMGAYWFTSSTSFANPAVTLARALTDTFAGIRPDDVLGFVAAQLIAVGLITVLVRRKVFT
jgi:glycerol uptake facilitator-like aquaporin